MIALLALGLLLGAASHQGEPVKPPASISAKPRPVVIVDAGHGGPDAGMTGPIGKGSKIYEKNITLAVAKRLGAALTKRGAEVVYTRTTDTLIALSDRGQIANKAGGAMFISIHVNASDPTWRDGISVRGFETYFLSDAPPDDAQRVEEIGNASVKIEAL